MQCLSLMNNIKLKPGQISSNKNTISRLQSLQQSKPIVFLFFFFLSLFFIFYISREALVAGRTMVEFSNLTTKFHQELNYDFYWTVNETSKILGVPYDGDDLEDYDLGERDNSIEGSHIKKC